MKDEPSVRDASSQDAFEKLKAILLEPDQRKIRQLEKELIALRNRFEDKEKFLQALEPVIIKALDEKIAASREEMAKALAPVMGPAIKKQITEAQDEIVDALYPVIGATIRKSVTEAMKNLARTVNEKVDKALSFHFLFQKMKARFSGVSEADLLLKETLPFHIHEIFFIHHDSGLLIEHLSGNKPLSTDGQDMIAGMLTAIRDFASNAFKTDTEQDVNEIQYNDFQIILESGRKFYLAVVISGIPHKRFYSLLHKVTRDINKKYAKPLRSFEGDTAEFSGVRTILQKLIDVFEPGRVDEPEERKPRGLLYLAGLVVLILAIYFGWFYRPQPDLPATPEKQRAVIGHPIDFQKFINAVNKNAGTDFDAGNAPFKLIYEPQYLIIKGTVPTETIRRQVSTVAAEMSDFPVIINELEIEQKQIPSQALKKRIEQRALYFDKGKTALTAQHKTRLDSIASWLMKINFKHLTIRGHSDSSGSEAVNNMVSRQRARSVYRYLIKKGVKPEKLSVTALGSTQPLDSNTTLAGQAKNRRVELRFEE